MLAFSIMQFFIHSEVLDNIIAAVSILILCIYIIVDTQLIIGSNSRKYAIDDYKIELNGSPIYMDVCVFGNNVDVDVVCYEKPLFWE